MRLRAIIFAVLALGSAGAAAWQIGVAAAGRIERLTASELRDALRANGQDWAGVEVDGLIVGLVGAAPDERAHLRAVEAVHARVAMRRIEDRSTLRVPDPAPAPEFAVQLMRNWTDISLIGLVPGADSHERVRQALARVGLDSQLADMMETVDYAPPAGWDDSLVFGLDLLADIPRARITVEAGRVTVAAVLPSDSERAALAAALRAAAPDGVALELDLSAPRPVIAPFRLDFRLDASTGSLIACTAETAEAAERILGAARSAGLAGDADCTLGLGAPSVDWASAAVEGISALKELGGGGFALTDSHAELIPPDGVDDDAIDAAVQRLAAVLPEGYALTTAVASQRNGAEAVAEVYEPEFSAVLGPDGGVALIGAVRDVVSQAAIESYAAALFGHDRVRSRTVIDPQLPEGWPVRVLAGIEALSEITEGRLAITSDAITLSGRSLDTGADARLEALLAARSPGEIDVEVRYDALAAAQAAAAARPAPERCAGEVGAILDDEAIVFRAGSAEIDPISSGVIAAIADVLRQCPGATFQVAGHTDSSGPAEANQRLSESRAAAVADALQDHELPLIDLRPVGYGSARPRTSNATPQGRALNRRIELVLVDPAQVREEIETAALAAPIAADASAAPDEPDCAAEVGAILATAPIEFDLGSSRISGESADTVGEVATVLGRCGSGQSFEIAGHTDDRGPAEVNQRLSEERAEAVRVALAAAEGLEGIVLVARGYGPDRPIAGNDTLEGRTRNRRIEISLLPAAPEGAVEPTVIHGPQ